MTDARRNRREVVILVRIDNMDTFTTEGQRSIRFELDDADHLGIDDAVQRALSQAPPVTEWQGF